LGSADFTLLYPRDKAFGDFAVNIHQLKKLQLSDEEIIEKLKSVNLFESVELTSSFINLRINRNTYIEELNTLLEHNTIKSLANKHTQRISLEFGQPNTHKLPHIGHLFSYTYGEAMARILLFCGHTIFRCNFQ
jgi:arginyl-tRNA synthetase